MMLVQYTIKGLELNTVRFHQDKCLFQVFSILRKISSRHSSPSLLYNLKYRHTIRLVGSLQVDQT